MILVVIQAIIIPFSIEMAERPGRPATSLRTLEISVQRTNFTARRSSQVGSTQVRSQRHPRRGRAVRSHSVRWVPRVHHSGNPSHPDRIDLPLSGLHNTQQFILHISKRKSLYSIMVEVDPTMLVAMAAALISAVLFLVQSNNKPKAVEKVRNHTSS